MSSIQQHLVKSDLNPREFTKNLMLLTISDIAYILKIFDHECFLKVQILKLPFYILKESSLCGWISEGNRHLNLDHLDKCIILVCNRTPNQIFKVFQMFTFEFDRMSIRFRVRNNRDSKTTEELTQILEKNFIQIRKVLNSSKDKRNSNIELVLKYSYYICNESGEKTLKNKIFINDNLNDDKVQLKIKQKQMVEENIETGLKYLKLSIKTLASFTDFNIENILDHTLSFSTQKTQNSQEDQNDETDEITENFNSDQISKI